MKRIQNTAWDLIEIALNINSWTKENGLEVNASKKIILFYLRESIRYRPLGYLDQTESANSRVSGVQRSGLFGVRHC